MEQLTEERLSRYLNVTQRALEKVKIISEGKVESWESAANDFLDMARRYYEDALHFREKGRDMDAFAAVNYAHGWLDAGARLGLFDVEHDNTLFTVD